MFLLRETLPNLDCHVRFFHAAASNNAPAVNIIIDGKTVATDIPFSGLTKYLSLSSGDHEITIFDVANNKQPLYSETVTILPISIQTYSAVLLESNLTLFRLRDGTSVEKSDLSFVRFINLSPNAPLLSLSLPNQETLFNGVEYLETTGYYPLSPGIYNFLVSATNDAQYKKFMKNTSIKPGQLYTIYIIGIFDGNPRLGSYITEDGIITEASPTDLKK